VEKQHYQPAGKKLSTGLSTTRRAVDNYTNHTATRATDQEPRTRAMGKKNSTTIRKMYYMTPLETKKVYTFVKLNA
jgi:hypothetical protein